MYERIGDKLLPWPDFFMRMLLSALVAFGIVAVALLAGILGYHSIAHLRWIDSLLNASMILTGMGPVDPMTSTAAKLFASGYALFSGVVFLSAVGIVIAPIFHRLLHKFHLDDDS
jgi:predicted DNA repair protein MutK